MIEKWRKNMDKGKSYAALLSDLSKAFDCIVHDFLTAKLEAYGFSYEALKVMYNYLTDRKHRTKVNNSFRDFIDLLLGRFNFRPSFIQHLHLRSFPFC